MILSVVLVYLILMAQFRSFLDPLIILTAIPPGLTGVVLILFVTGTSLNIMSLMGVTGMMTGIVVSEQYSNRGIFRDTAPARRQDHSRSGGRSLQGAVASSVDDLAGHTSGDAADGARH